MRLSPRLQEIPVRHKPRIIGLLISGFALIAMSVLMVVR